jgi:hypothetical protein
VEPPNEFPRVAIKRQLIGSNPAAKTSNKIPSDAIGSIVADKKLARNKPKKEISK